MTTDASVASEPTKQEASSMEQKGRSSSTWSAASGAAIAWSSQLAAAWNAVEHRLVAASDWLNPILVKETRQALKSWQFAWAFVLLLVGCWVVTIVRVSFVGPSIYYAAAGSEMLLWYFGILAFFLTVVVPYSTFRSLASEREDNTYDLLSITALRPRQIISGKLGSAVAQMVVYFSAITPCLAFTYLLRGIDVPTIVLLLSYAFLGSLGLSMFGLMLATLARQRYSQVVLSVAFVALLLGAFWLAMTVAVWLVWEGYTQLGNPGFWIGHAALANLYVTTFALAFFAAAGMITFATENRSTPLRIVMLIQQASWIGWLSLAWIESSYRVEPALAMALIAGCYWFLMGTLLTGERAEMSRRVMRRLPQSFLGRMLFTWFNPGPGTGYMFVVANLTAIVVIALMIAGASEWLRPGGGGGWPGIAGLVTILVIGWGYVVAYLGLGLLAIALLRRFAVVTMFAGVLIHVLLVLAGSGIPTSIQMMSIELRNVDYSYLQITNPVWTLIYLTQFTQTPEADVLLAVIPAAAVCVLLVNLPGLVRELRQERVALPARVAEDEAELHPLPAPGPANPWDGSIQ